MATERVRGEDEKPVPQINADALAGRYRVTAKDGIHLDGVEGVINKNEEVDLNSNAARALLNDGSIERVKE